MKTYRNRFAEMEQTSKGTWTVTDKVQGMAICEDWHGQPIPVEYKTYQAARDVMVGITSSYLNLEGKMGY
jgi:hypothetical protein